MVMTALLERELNTRFKNTDNEDRVIGRHLAHLIAEVRDTGGHGDFGKIIRPLIEAIERRNLLKGGVN